MQDQLARGAETLASVKLDASSLIWLDSCDVQTTRAAVATAQRTGATIHVGQSPGSVAVKSAMFGGAWFGTTLAEVPARAELIVTVGDGLLSEAPLLADRFFKTPERSTAPRSTAPHWIHISAHEQSSGEHASRRAEATLLEPHADSALAARALVRAAIAARSERSIKLASSEG